VSQPIAERSANRRLERARLVLKPVARADIADRNAAHIDKGRATELGNGSSGFVYRRAKFRLGNARLYTNDGFAARLAGLRISMPTDEKALHRRRERRGR